VMQVSGGQMILFWPPDHLGWRLESQTNSQTVGLGTNWVSVSNSTATNLTSISLDPANASVFYRLVLP
jgi:hypothetical protein